MPDLSGILLRKSARSVDSGLPRCSSCHRIPLVGERLHEMTAGPMLCELCVSQLPEGDRDTLRSERVHASEHHLRIAPRAA